MWRGGLRVQATDVLHGQQQEDPGQAHDELAPLEVGGPDAAEQVLQLLLHGIMAGEGERWQLQNRRVGRVGPAAVAEQTLDLQSPSQPSANNAVSVIRKVTSCMRHIQNNSKKESLACSVKLTCNFLLPPSI